MAISHTCPERYICPEQYQKRFQENSCNFPAESDRVFQTGQPGLDPRLTLVYKSEKK